MEKYQVMPDLTEEEYEALKEDIAARGVQIPIEFDTEGNCIDGHHRLKICEELGIKDYPTATRIYGSEEEKFTQARALNMVRRHLTRAQRTELIRDQIKATPGRSDRQMASELGVSPTTVGTVRKLLEASGDVSKLDTTVDTLGREQPRQRKRRIIAVYDPSEREAEALKDPDIVRRLQENEKLDVRGAIREQKRDQLVAHLEDPEVQREKAEQGVFDVVVVEPPEIMGFEELRAIKVPAYDICHVFLWVDGGHIREGIETLKAWGVKPVLSFVCYRHEGKRIENTPFIETVHFILYGHIGAPKFVDEKQFWACVDGGPEEFYKMIKRVTAGRRVIMFGKSEGVDGFDHMD